MIAYSALQNSLYTLQMAKIDQRQRKGNLPAAEQESIDGAIKTLKAILTAELDALRETQHHTSNGADLTDPDTILDNREVPECSANIASLLATLESESVDSLDDGFFHLMDCFAANMHSEIFDDDGD